MRRTCVPYQKKTSPWPGSGYLAQKYNIGGPTGNDDANAPRHHDDKRHMTTNPLRAWKALKQARNGTPLTQGPRACTQGNLEDLSWFQRNPRTEEKSPTYRAEDTQLDPKQCWYCQKGQCKSGPLSVPPIQEAFLTVHRDKFRGWTGDPVHQPLVLPEPNW